MRALKALGTLWGTGLGHREEWGAPRRYQAGRDVILYCFDGDLMLPIPCWGTRVEAGDLQKGCPNDPSRDWDWNQGDSEDGVET